MDVINVKKFGYACGFTALFLYLGCVIVILTTSREMTIAFFNSLMHGIDVTTVLRTEMSAAEMFYGLVQIFVLGWLAGACIASIYNFHCIKFDNKAKQMKM